MKDEILELIYHKIRWGVARTSILGKTELANEIERLMCYREVRAFFEGASCYWKRAEGKCIEYFSSKYPESIILEAIEKVKKEQQ